MKVARSKMNLTVLPPAFSVVGIVVKRAVDPNYLGLNSSSDIYCVSLQKLLTLLSFLYLSFCICKVGLIIMPSTLKKIIIEDQIK